MLPNRTLNTVTSITPLRSAMPAAIILSTCIAITACGGSDSSPFDGGSDNNQMNEQLQSNQTTNTTSVSTQGGSDSNAEESSNNENTTLPTDNSGGEVITTTSGYPFEVVGECAIDEQMQQLLVAVNEARAEERNCGFTAYPATLPLRWHCQLAQAALLHSTDMVNSGIFSHTGSDGSSVRQRTQRQGYSGGRVGENIAAGYRSVEDVMGGWLTSSGHCKNIMNSAYNDFGAGLVFRSGSAYQYYWTQNFGFSSD